MGLTLPLCPLLPHIHPSWVGVTAGPFPGGPQALQEHAGGELASALQPSRPRLGSSRPLTPSPQAPRRRVLSRLPTAPALTHCIPSALQAPRVT